MRLLALTFSLFLTAGAFAADRVIVHEWGTFTVLQDEHGNAVAGINTDDEPLPDFVHTLNGKYGARVVHTSTSLTPALGKAVPECHPDVKLRLETPVTYFYLPDNYEGAITINVRVAFQGGWLTEFFPRADVEAPGFDFERMANSRLAPDAVGTLNWRMIKLGADGDGPKSDSNVWTAPRKTRSLSIENRDGEVEKFLFYRGVSNIDAPLRVAYSFIEGSLKVSPGTWPTGEAIDTIEIPKLWLVDIAENGTVAFADLGALKTATKAPGQFPLDIQAAPHTAQDLSVLRASMHAALIADGLYPDEASAMLRTWELSYFKSAGTRLFFIVPREWTDAAIPIDFNLPVDLTRAMIGRVELINPQQRASLRSISMTKVSDYETLTRQLRSIFNSQDKILTTKEALALGMPQPYSDFLQLGRFRSALVLHEQAARPTPDLSAFIDKMRIASNY